MKTILILNFASLTGMVRDMAVTEAIETLYELGFHFNFKAKGIQGLQNYYPKLIVNGDDIDPRRLYNSDDDTSFYNPKGTVIDFQAATQLDAFLERAKEILQPKVVKQNIFGVDVTITRQGVTLDASEFLRKVEIEAQQIRAETFGKE